MLLLDPRGVAWSASGTRVLREGALVADLPGEAQSLQDDDEGNIWVSTTDGFVRLQPALAVVRDRHDAAVVLADRAAIFVDGRRCADAVAQTDVLQPDSRIYVMQALSGG